MFGVICCQDELNSSQSQFPNSLHKRVGEPDYISSTKETNLTNFERHVQLVASELKYLYSSILFSAMFYEIKI